MEHYCLAFEKLKALVRMVKKLIVDFYHRSTRKNITIPPAFQPGSHHSPNTKHRWMITGN